MTEHIVTGRDAAGDPGCGNKAARLAELHSAGFRVPEFIVIPPEADLDDREFVARLDASVRASVPGSRYAVRSSARDEDGSGHSHAGLYTSFLEVPPDQLAARIRDVRASGDLDRLRLYREMHGIQGESGTPSVMVQMMIGADAAGVAFAADPVSGRTDRLAVAAVRGLGEALVSGERSGDRWTLDSSCHILETHPERAGTTALTKRQVRRVARLAARVSSYVGRPQDIEWALVGRRLYLLQARDITTLDEQAGGGHVLLWDNSNIVESYGGVTTPLTFSVARTAYADAYRNLGRMIGISERTIRAHQRDYEQMIGLIDGRVYYNLISWYRLLMLIPGFRYNRRFMEQMMGVTQQLPAGALPAPESGRFASLRSAAGLTSVGLRLAWRLFRHARQVRRFHTQINAALAPQALANDTERQLCDGYEELQSRVVPAWDTPLVNDLYCMLFHGLLRSLCARWLPEDLKDSHNELLRGESTLVSLEPVRRMRRMAALVRGVPGLADALEAADERRIVAEINAHPDLAAEYRDYLDRFGDRCIDELKLESPTLRDDPGSLRRAIAQLARQAPRAESDVAESTSHAIEIRVREALRSPIRRAVLRIVLGRARAAVRDRENMRFERTRVYGRVRSIAVELGRRLRDTDVLASADDVFYLEIDELLGFVHGTGCGSRLGDLVRVRRQEFEDYRHGDAPPRRFITVGPPQLQTSRRPVDDTAPGADGDVLHADACSPGRIRGPARIVRDPRSAVISNGDILVAERTDPGWVTLFPACAGIVMERGSLLSHTAIVARELGIPCIVGAEGACRWLEEGQWVELDASAGTLRRLPARERAA